MRLARLRILSTFALALLAEPLAVEAQQAKIARLGVPNVMGSMPAVNGLMVQAPL